MDETYAKITGRCVYLYRAIDQFGQVIDVLVAEKRDVAATRRFFARALEHGPSPIEVTLDALTARNATTPEVPVIWCLLCPDRQEIDQLVRTLVRNW